MKSNALWYLSPIILAILSISWLYQVNSTFHHPMPPEASRKIQSENSSREQHLLDIGSDLTRDALALSLKLDGEGNIVGFDVGGPEFARAQYNLASVENGIEIKAPKGSPAALFNPLGSIQTANFDASSGGNLKISFPRNALTHSMGEYEFSIVKEQGQWIALSSAEDGRRPFNYAHLRATKVYVPFVGNRIYGVDRVEVMQLD
jgi:hypothetical protein